MKNKMTLTKEQILSVYSGIDGKCLCGCAGKYFYPKDRKREASSDRGYPVGSDEINDRMVAKVVRLINEADPDAVECESSSFGTNYSVVVGNRLYVAYLAKEFK